MFLCLLVNTMVQQSVDMPVAQVLSLNTGDPEMKEKSHDQTRRNHCKFDLFPVVQVVFWGTIQDCRLFPNNKRKEARASLGWSDVGPMGPSGKGRLRSLDVQRHWFFGFFGRPLVNLSMSCCLI